MRPANKMAKKKKWEAHMKRVREQPTAAFATGFVELRSE